MSGHLQLTARIWSTRDVYMHFIQPFFSLIFGLLFFKMSKRSGKMMCSVVGCSTRYCNTDQSVKLYSFPGRPHEIDLRRKWILAVNRKNADGTLWTPSKSSRICSKHFIGGRKSQHPASPAYVPSIFPECYKKKSIETDSLNRFTRWIKRSVNRNSVVSTHDISKVQDSEPVLATMRAGAQTQSKRNCDVESNFEFSSVLDGENVSTQVMEVALVSDIKTEPTEPPMEEMPSEDSLSEEPCRTTDPLHYEPEDVFVAMPKTEPDYPEVEVRIKEEFPQYHDIKQEICTEEVNIEDNMLYKSAEWEEPDMIIKPRGRQFTCSICNKEFLSKKSLVRHELIHNVEKSFKCDTCLKGFSQRCSLMRHLRTHSNMKLYRCTMCCKAYSQMSSLRKHRIVQHSKEHIDQLCTMLSSRHIVDTESQDVQLSNHIQLIKYSCKICSRVFASNSNLRRHYGIHSVDRMYECLYCARMFSRKDHLKTHMLVHTGERDHVCSICGRTFSLRASLKKHLLIHSKQKK